MRESAEFLDDAHVHSLQVCCHLQHHVVGVVGKTQIFTALGKTLFTHHVLACVVVVDGENIRFHKFDDVSRAKLQVLICKNYILFAFIKSGMSKVGHRIPSNKSVLLHLHQRRMKQARRQVDIKPFGDGG